MTENHCWNLVLRHMQIKSFEILEERYPVESSIEFLISIEHLYKLPPGGTVAYCFLTSVFKRKGSWH
jgi:hypothetical protein